MSASTCAHGFPSPASCVECMEEGVLAPPPKPKPEQVVIGPIRARWDAHCGGCNLPIVVGHSIVKTDRERWIHLGCLPGVPSL